MCALITSRNFTKVAVRFPKLLRVGMDSNHRLLPYSRRYFSYSCDGISSPIVYRYQLKIPIHLSCRHSEHARTFASTKPMYPLCATSSLIFRVNAITYTYSIQILTMHHPLPSSDSVISSHIVDKMAQQDC